MMRTDRGGKERKIVRGADGNKVIIGKYGLSLHRPSLRYYTIDDHGKRVYFGKDLAVAVARFREWVRQQEGVTGQADIQHTLPLGALLDLHDVEDWRRQHIYRPFGGTWRDTDSPTPLTEDDLAKIKEKTGKTDLDLLFELTSANEWARIRHMLIDDPNRFSDHVGVRVRVQHVDTSMSLAELGNLFQKKRVSKGTLAKRKLHWTEFSESVAPAQTVADVTVDQVRAYRDELLDRLGAENATKETPQLEPKTVAHRFDSVVTIINHAFKEGKSSPDLIQLKEHCKMLVPPTTNGQANPHPISVEDWEALYKAAYTPYDLILLLGLNLAHYPSEVVSINWGHLNLKAKTYAKPNRGKTDNPRIGILWDRTVKRLRQHMKDTNPKPKPTDPVFRTKFGRLSEKTVSKHFVKIRPNAKVAEDVKFEHLRDGAAQATSDAQNVLKFDSKQEDVLLGHKSGMKAKYILRRPQLVEEACAAIEAHYFRQKSKGQRKKKGE